MKRRSLNARSETQPGHTLGGEGGEGSGRCGHAVFSLAARAPVPCCFFVSDGIVLDGQWETTEANAGVFDCDECALLQVVLQHRESPLEDSVDELDSYGTQAKGDEGWILASRQGNDRSHVEILG